jgi:hypothetical protein
VVTYTTTTTPPANKKRTPWPTTPELGESRLRANPSARCPEPSGACSSRVTA